MKDKSSWPEIIKNGLDVSGYDRILLGYPVWWYTAPTNVNSFLEAYVFSGKEIIIWATSGGSGDDAYNTLKMMFYDREKGFKAQSSRLL